VVTHERLDVSLQQVMGGRHHCLLRSPLRCL